MAIPENTEALEKLLIEVVGDDSNLKAFLDDAVKAAQKAAEEMRDALAVDFTRVSQGAQQAASAFEQVAPAVQDANAVLEMYTTRSQQAFDDVRRAGRMTSEQFEKLLFVAVEIVGAASSSRTTAVRSWRRSTRSARSRKARAPPAPRWTTSRSMCGKPPTSSPRRHGRRSARSRSRKS